jgi:ubiquinone/menaquinone biosynthesis C-methylase UbiE
MAMQAAEPLDFLPSIGQSSWLVPKRLDQPELLDLGVGSPEDVKTNFDDMWRINRWLGGVRALTQHLYPRLLRHTETVSILDIGTGSAQIPTAIACWALKHRLNLHIFAVDWSARNLEVARTHLSEQTLDVSLMQADAMSLPFPEKSVDYVISSLFMHHFTPDQNIKLLRQASKIARRGIIMSDLVRGWLPFISFKLSQPIFARSYLTRYDGALSVRRAYTASEFVALAEAAGLSQINVHQHFPWRMTLVVDHV